MNIKEFSTTPATQKVFNNSRSLKNRHTHIQTYISMTETERGRDPDFYWAFLSLTDLGKLLQTPKF